MAEAAAVQFITGMWYALAPSAGLKAGAMQPHEFMGEPLLLARRADGSIFAIRNVCPHRAMPLHYGKFDGGVVECCYHGWKFDGAGRCVHIPSLVGHEAVECQKIKVPDWPVQESCGFIWVFAGTAAEAAKMPIPALPDFALTKTPKILISRVFPNSIDHAVVGLIDPAHGPYVHQNWWWRNARSMHIKKKAFGPSDYGFVMKKHRPSSNSFAYKILGGKPQTEINFQLPGLRIESIEIGQASKGQQIFNLTTVTPINSHSTLIQNALYWTVPWLNLFKPILRHLAGAFLDQDGLAVARQQEGLRTTQNLLLIREADTQARWYYQLKNEMIKARAEQREFRNPVTDVELSWRS